MTKYCVIGKSLPHTLSPEIHALLKTGVYEVRELECVKDVERLLRSGEFKGANVTIPYKRDVMDFVDVLSDEAKKIGAVNTVVEKDGKLYGYNTDAGGMELNLKVAGIALSKKNVMILGSGGTSKTANYLAKKAGARDIYIVSRSGEINYDNCYDLSPQVIINTTPVGMMPNAFCAPVELERFKSVTGVFDAIYNPLSTRLVLEARRQKIKAANGLLMLVEQARLARNLFAEAEQKQQISTKNSMQICKSLEKSRRNIVLVGMAGSGKSVLGKRIADALGREFVDTDKLVEQKMGKSPEQIILGEGERAFREIEAEVVKEACSAFSRVIATGGGAVMREDNAFYMKSNGFIVHVKRNALATEGRPLSKDIETARALYEQRKPVYTKLADATVSNDGGLLRAEEQILAAWEAF